jgi:2-oxoglutarate dehydrogenase E2 component (dihydrolipoamide succinyltransferase)
MAEELELKVPSVGESITEVQIGKWFKTVGQQVQKDENVVELESDKATVDLPAPATGTISKVLKQSGQTAGVGEVIGYLQAGAPAAANAAAPPTAQPAAPDGHAAAPAPANPSPGAGMTVSVEKRKGQTAIGSVQAAPSAQAAPAAAPIAQPGSGSRAFVMPAAERALAQHDLPAESVRATGPGGRLLKEDVLRQVEQPAVAAIVPPMAAAPAKSAPAKVAPVKSAPNAVIAERVDLALPSASVSPLAREEEFVVMSPIRRRIAQRLVDAQQQAALLTTFNEVDMTEVMSLRQKHKDAYQQRYGVKLGFMSFFVKASIDALKQFPQVNAEVRDPHVVYRNYYDIGIAVGGGKGLVVPILRNAEFMSFAEIEVAIGDFARRAADNKLKLDELQGGTFTISNGGVYGSLMSTPIVNPPQSGILGLHAIQDRPVARGGQVVIRPMMYLALTYDHRIVDGREAVSFLKRVKDTIEDPSRILLEV